VESVGKSFYLINFRGGGKAFATVAQRGKDWHGAAGDTFHVDFVARAFLHPKNECRTGNVLEAGVLDPKFVRPFRLDFNGGGHMPEVRANERESGFVFKNRGFTLPSNEQSMSVNCQPGEGLDVTMAWVPPKK